MSYEYRGKTALITGASGGLGEVFARQLAARGMNLILVARSEAKLRGLAEELARTHSVKADAIASDLSKPGAGAALHAATKAKGLAVDLLINNAGFGSFGRFETIDPKQESEMVQVNIATPLELCHAYIPDMLARGGGTVVNVASTAGFQPMPYFSTYAATKAFLLSFSDALWAEYRKRGVHVLAVCPGPTRTGFFDATKSDVIEKVGLFQNLMMSSDKVVAQSLRALERRKHYVVTGWINWIAAHSSRFGPRWLVALVTSLMTRPPVQKPA